LVLFLGQFGFESSTVRYGFAIAYVVLSVGLLVFHRETRLNLWDSLLHVVGRGRREEAERTGAS
jgi:hypothetical protein